MKTDADEKDLLEPNIHAGVKYIRRLISDYLQDEPMDALDKVLFAFASYNCAAFGIRALRIEDARSSPDANYHGLLLVTCSSGGGTDAPN